MLIYNAEIITMRKENYDNGFIEFNNGKIVSLGNMNDLKLKITDKDYNANGYKIYPGFIDPHSHVGVFGNSLGFEGNDANEITDPITPHLRADDAVNPMDFCFTEAAGAGITTVVTGVGSANPIGGTMIAMKTHGSKRLENRILKSPLAIKMALGENPKTCYNDRDESPITRMATAALIREQLQKASIYKSVIEKANDPSELPEYDIKCEALLPLLNKEINAHFHCHRADDIFTAIRLANEFGIGYVLIHATDSGLIADELAEIGSNCIIGPIICDRSKPELANLNFDTAAKLRNKGINFALCTDHPVMPIQLLALASGLTMRGGLSEFEALKSITVNAAEICGISDRVGSLGVGMDADFVILKDKFYDVLSVPVAVFIDGERVL